MQGLSGCLRFRLCEDLFMVAHTFDAGPLVNAAALLNAGSFFDV